MRKVTLATALFCFLAAGFLGAVEARFPRHPAPSPDGTLIAFSWQADLWTVPATGGTARRLTAHPAADRFPVWSRDGNWLAFASDRYGSLDVFLMPADSSAPPVRLTFASVDDVPVDFTPDGSAVLFVSRRDEAVRWMSSLYLVPVTGGTPSLAQPALGQWAAYSPNDGGMAFVRGATKWVRRGYRGPANRELWLHTADDEDVQLTHFDGDDDRPNWVNGHELAFLSARAGRKNVCTMDIVTGEVTVLTHHQGSDVRAPRVVADGSYVAYEFEDALWTVPLPAGEPHKVHIEVPADRLSNALHRATATKDAGELAVSPDGSMAAFTVHGNVFLTAIRSKEDQEIAPSPTVRITSTSAREHGLAWSPDGNSLLLSSDRSGNDDLYVVRPRKAGTPWLEALEYDVRPLTASPAEEHDAKYSPDGKHIAFVRGKGKLVVANADATGEVTVLDHWYTPQYAWSPDGRWLAYSIPDLEYNTDVWIVSAGGGTPYNVSRHPDEDVEPSWSPDGKRLLWASKRHADTMDVWGVWLTRSDDERTPEDWLRAWKKPAKNGSEEKASAGKSGGKEATSEQPEELPNVAIDFDRLWERSHALTELTGDEGTPLATASGKKVIFTAMPEGELDLYAVRYDGHGLKRLTEGGKEPSAVQMSKDGKTIFFLDKNGAIKRVSTDGKSGDPIPFSARSEIGLAAEQVHVFNETWRALNEWFYDPAFHGIDWEAQRSKYGAWLSEGMDETDFADLVNLMLGELNSSHMGYYPKRRSGGERTGFIGALFDPGAGGPGIRVREVLTDGPSARRDVNLKTGDRVLAVNGVKVAPTTNIYGLFADTVGRKVVVKVLDGQGHERTVVVTPVGARPEYQLRYNQWVRQRRAIADKLSGGRLGYLHIQGMNMPSFEEFEQDLYAAAHGKEGLIIDVRSNGGGWTTDYLMAVLNVRRHAFTVPRDAGPAARAYPQGRLPLAAWTKPAAALCNEDSYSNAEIFSHAFRTLGRGPLVGMPTFGAVISTGAHTLLNGARVRLPMRGWYVAGSGINMEHNGAVPDVTVAQPPAEDTSPDTDTQLARAVTVLLDDLATDPRTKSW